MSEEGRRMKRDEGGVDEGLENGGSSERQVR